jgi:hypothetical protein
MTLRKLFPLAAAAILLLGLAGSAAAGHRHDRHHGIEGSGKAETRSFDFDGFDKVRLDAGMDLDIRVGRGFDVAVTLDDNLFDNLILEVDHGVLVIGWDESCHPDVDALMKLDLPKFTHLQINGAGDVEIEGFDGGDFEFELNGACDLKAAGKLDELEIDLRGAGNVEAEKLKARKVDVTIAGAGNVECWAEDEIRAVVNGVGEITYAGDPAKQKTSVHGIGSIDAR